jgi:hypothetical protein
MKELCKTTIDMYISMSGDIALRNKNYNKDEDGYYNDKDNKVEVEVDDDIEDYYLWQINLLTNFCYQK